MTRDDAKRLAEEIGLRHSNKAREKGLPPGVAIEIGARAYDAAREALDRALLPERERAAEQDVVEAAEALLDAADVEHSPCRGNLFDMIASLRALRKQREAEECGHLHAFEIAPRIANSIDMVHSRSAVGRCTKPRGHTSNGDPEHSGPLGNWTWRDA